MLLHKPKIVKLLLVILAVFLVPSSTLASTDISPILTNTVSTTTPNPNAGFLLFKGDQRSGITSCTPTIDTGGVAPNETFDLENEMNLVASTTGVYTFGIGTLINDACPYFHFNEPTLDVYGVLQWTGSAIDTTYEPMSSSTSIDLLNPYDQQTISSSSPTYTLEAFGKVAPEDNDTRLLLSFKITPDFPSQFDPTVTPCINPLVCSIIGLTDTHSTTIELPYSAFIGLSGDGTFEHFDIATTTATPSNIGTYILHAELYTKNTAFGFSSLFGLSFGKNLLAQKTVSFNVGTPYSFKTIAAATATSTEQVRTSCNPISGGFDIGICINALFLPSGDDISTDFSLIKDGFLSRVPIGYATRMITILSDQASSTATSTLPAFTVTFPVGSPLHDDPTTFDMQEMITNGASTLSSVTDPISGKTLREITEPWIQLFIALTAFIIIFHDIMGAGSHSIGGKGKNNTT